MVTVLFANRSYKIFQGELERVGLENVSPTARGQFELTPSDLDWVKLANGMGVPAERAESAEEFNKYLKAAISSSGKVGRNAPCPCGSGKKYKKWCLIKA